MNVKMVNDGTIVPYEPDRENAVVFGGCYIVYRDGTIYRICKKERLVLKKQWVHTNGYMRVCLFGNKEYVHRIVAKCFCRQKDGCNVVNHIDGDKKNNKAENLEWVTVKQNAQHAYATGLIKKENLLRASMIGVKKKNGSRRVLSQEEAREIKYSKKSGNQLSKIYKVSKATVWRIRNNVVYKEV